MVRFGIVGCGRIGQRHAEHIKRLAILHAVCDIREHPAKTFSSEYGCRYYLHLEDMLKSEKEIDVISVCTPNGLHAEHTIESLRSGKHVLCEKPMALTARDCEKMIKEAEESNRKLFVVKQNRYNPPVQILKKLIDEKIIGKIFSVQVNCFWNRNDEYYRSSEWKGTTTLDGGTLFTQFSHFIDLLYWLFGDVKRTYAFTKNYLHEGIIDFEDTGTIILEMFEGIIGTIHYTVNSYEKNMEGSITVFGERGTVKIGGQYLNVLEYQNIDGYKIKNIPESRPPNEYGFYRGSMSNHDKVIQNVIDVLGNNGTIEASGFDGLKTVQIIEKIYHSARIGNE
ncbi:MAG: Gfo/Idh/MocA family oxidoreductase [Deltaproteobacteria bacterium]|nr:Gfo/Idh/MocA family oxidoreductase [Deltaproteobacteria bacterium]NIS78275.1 Gfo/Idh/MocA family oxidoreductase [Deltaproteobacteria bacterium]